MASIKSSKSCNEVPCIFTLRVHEFDQEHQESADQERWREYDATRKVSLPFMPALGQRFGKLIPPTPPGFSIWYVAGPGTPGDDKGDEEDEYGFESWTFLPLTIHWDLVERAFVVKFWIEILFPIGTSLAKLRRLYPDWKFARQRQRSPEAAAERNGWSRSALAGEESPS